MPVRYIYREGKRTKRAQTMQIYTWTNGYAILKNQHIWNTWVDFSCYLSFVNNEFKAFMLCDSKGVQHD